ncbi:hypothetical protein AMS62_06100 [Bacillus sp. FJAT-18019]|nr:hypothetical protein AMS62_06100 [Bacillus sp. FJAT-18019]
MVDRDQEGKPSNYQTFSTQLLSDKKKLIDELQNNEKYVDYLSRKDLEITDAITFLENVSKLNQTILNGCLFLVALLYILICYTVLRYRIRLFIVAGSLYVFSILNTLTSNIVADLFFKPMRWCISLLGDNLEYSDYILSVNYLVPATKEAFLSFIIIDTITQFYRDKKIMKTNTMIKKIYYSIPATIKELRSIDRGGANLRVAKLRIDLNYFITYCKKNKKDPYLKELKILIEQNYFDCLNKHKSISIDEAIKLLKTINDKMQHSPKIIDIIGA